MQNPPLIRQQLDRELDRLPPESLTQVLAFTRSLQPQTDYTTLWENWFAEVDALPLNPQPPNVETAPPNYTDYLVKKYRRVSGLLSQDHPTPPTTSYNQNND